MLTELRVADLGIVEEITLAFGPGMTAITGETGAGKTLLVTALELLLGRRADPGMVRDGATEARVEGRFVGADGSEHILARVLPADGRSRAYVDGRLATAQELSELGAGLVDLHGQHAHQQLLAPATQRRALDRLAGPAAADALAEVREAREAARTARAALDGLGGDERARAHEADLLRFQAEEIDQAAPTGPDEDDRLRVEEAALADATGLRAALAAAYEAVEEGAVDALGIAFAALGEQELLADLAERTRALQAEVTELGRDLRVATDGVVDDPERLEVVRTRRDALRRLRRKYGDTLADVLAFRADVAERLTRLEDHDALAGQLEAEVAAADRRAVEAASRLHDARVAAAGPAAAAVAEHLRELAMPRAEVEIAVEPGELTDDGADVVTFLLAANPGEAARPIARAASGGELARTMLAVRLVCSEGPATQVFDEVDAGIGGEAGSAVGRRLAALARDRQVLCVTHLAQVAAHADHQVVVEKAEADGRTVARAEVVADDARVRELSRMLAGLEASDHARRHAEELLAAARTATPGRRR